MSDPTPAEIIDALNDADEDVIHDCLAAFARERGIIYDGVWHATAVTQAYGRS